MNRIPAGGRLGRYQIERMLGAGAMGEVYLAEDPQIGRRVAIKTVRVEEGTIVFLETDKPIYKPGQTIRIRLLTLDSALRPVGGQATIEALDAKGIKVFKKAVTVDDYGMAALDLPLSSESNLGVWKLRAATGSGARRASSL